MSCSTYACNKCSESDLNDYSSMDSNEDEDIDSNVFKDVETVSFDDWRREHYDRDKSKQAINDEENNPKKKYNRQVITLGLQCPQSECELMFESSEQVRQHQEAVHGVLPYQCVISGCLKRYKFPSMEFHYSTAHPHHTNWTCAQCNTKRDFNDSGRLRRHIRQHHQIGRFACSHKDCSYEADIRSKVRRHFISSHKQLICSISGCANVFCYKYQLEDHCRSVHDLPEIVGSKKRPKKTSHSKATKRPKLSDYDDGVGEETTNLEMIILELKCPQSECNSVFVSMKQLRHHQKTIHGVHPFSCPATECSEQFASSRELESHYSAIHPDYHDWPCAGCNQKLKNAHQLHRHIREFHQFGLFHCAHLVCTFEADVRAKVRNHQSTAHRHYNCTLDACEMLFDSKPKLEQHYRSTHITEQMYKSENVIILEVKCPQSDCDTTFSTLTELQQHQQNAHGVLPFQCLVTGCSEQFNTSYQIGRHYSTVHPQHTNWTCSKCETKLANVVQLHRHIRQFHQFGRYRCSVECTFDADLLYKVRNHRRPRSVLEN